MIEIRDTDLVAKNIEDNDETVAVVSIYGSFHENRNCHHIEDNQVFILKKEDAQAKHEPCQNCAGYFKVKELELEGLQLNDGETIQGTNRQDLLDDPVVKARQDIIWSKNWVIVRVLYDGGYRVWWEARPRNPTDEGTIGPINAG